ncbi:MAG: zinc ABC transporter substrate-binding protein [Actinobacteria bacterium]|nr:zinc ABC transporter substrate-binding protein [Actinomycetota bacterium]MCB9413761.1 zinc ABC transporter substrate-binding protein [Actinomycetota bacterium]MCB9424755.1 zinc ABC transporter substrate-binding protein [Actinomycetota bacterium]HRY10332.1 metal ABC transporter substrate-binding protein [Candidatus Nanopelagicales bacterium]
MRARTLGVVPLVAAALVGCTRGVGDGADPTASAGVPPAITVAVADFPSEWLATRIGGDAVTVERIGASRVTDTDADLFAYVPGIDPAVDTAAQTLPEDHVVDLSDDVSRIASPRDPDVKDPYIWFDPINVSTMAQTLGTAMAEANPVAFEAYQFYGLRTFAVQNESLQVDQRLQEQLNPCRVATLVVEAPVLTYFARAYAFDQVPLISWDPASDPVPALYFTIDAEAAVRDAAADNAAVAIGVDTLTESAPEDDLLQGLLDLGETVAEHQDCPLVTPSSSDRPG